MPLVLTQNEVNLSNLEYADVLGETYEYPARYRTLILPGEQFVYYRGRRRADGSTTTPSYLGTGVVSTVNEIGDRYRCTITNYQPFEKPVGFKDGQTYREPPANSRKAVGFYFQVGVRSLDQIAYDAICRAGLPELPDQPGKYAAPNTAVEVDELAMALAMAEAEKRYPGDLVVRMPHNNPGFDIEVHRNGEIVQYIEVKGTKSGEPRFFISSGEIAHSRKYSNKYAIWIFHSIALTTRSGVLVTHEGAVTEDDFELEPIQYFGRALSGKPGQALRNADRPV
ncbi:UNVERIFIED_CONTAM: uncharacterized protein DUF3883 [Williamsia faeni]